MAFTLETERLVLLPLTARQLRLWAEDLPALETELGCRYQAETGAGFMAIVAGQVAAAEADEANYRYHSFWWMVRKSDRVVVGSTDFKAPPNPAGEVEIGYGLGDAHRGMGYMTEAVGAMCRWVLGQAGIRAVVAETEPDNPASERVLQRCGFVREAHKGPNHWWRCPAG